MHLYKNLAFTLVELAITLLVLSILFTLAAPYYHEIRAQQERRAIYRQIINNVQIAKQHALIHHTNVVICSTADNKTCKNSMWQHGFIVFLDSNKNRQIDNQEMLINSENTHLHYGSLNWRGTLNFSSLNFLSEHGLPIGSNGSFYYCSSQTHDHMKIILNKMGHVRSENLANC
jgi:prepilin-type N-terminal cleavage/methylation domain-containing protein